MPAFAAKMLAQPKAAKAAKPVKAQNRRAVFAPLIALPLVAAGSAMAASSEKWDGGDKKWNYCETYGRCK